MIAIFLAAPPAREHHQFRRPGALPQRRGGRQTGAHLGDGLWQAAALRRRRLHLPQRGDVRAEEDLDAHGEPRVADGAVPGAVVRVPAPDVDVLPPALPVVPGHAALPAARPRDLHHAESRSATARASHENHLAPGGI